MPTFSPTIALLAMAFVLSAFVFCGVVPRRAS
jgi:hypothetical protein